MIMLYKKKYINLLIIVIFTAFFHDSYASSTTDNLSKQVKKTFSDKEFIKKELRYKKY